MEGVCVEGCGGGVEGVWRGVEGVWSNTKCTLRDV